MSSTPWRPLVASFVLSFLWAACSADSVCGQTSTCEGCVALVGEGCGWCSGSCELETACAAPIKVASQCTSASGGSTSSGCTASYEGPSGDPQVSTQCMAVWNYRCRQNNPSAADQNCRVYDSLEATVACPYCPGSTGTGGGRGSGGGGGTTQTPGACYLVTPYNAPSCKNVQDTVYCYAPTNGGRFFPGKTCSDVTCYRDGGCTVR